MLRASVTLPDDLLKEAKAAAGNNLSALVAEALRKYLKDAKTKKLSIALAVGRIEKKIVLI